MRYQGEFRVWVRLFVLALLPSAVAQGQVVSTFVNPLGGVWSDAANWDSVDFPNNNGVTYTARLLALAGAYTVDLDLDVTLDAFVLDSAEPTLDLGAFSLDVLNDFSMSQGLILSAGAGGITSGGSTSLSDVTLMGLSTFTTNGTLDFLGGVCNDLCDTPLLHLGSAVNWSGGGDILLGEGSSFTHGVGSTFTIANDSTLFSDSAGATPQFVNDGVLLKQGGAGMTIFDDVEFVNNGTLQIETGTFRTDGVDLAGNGNVLDIGTWNVLNGTSLELVDDVGVTQQVHTNQVSVTLRGAGAQFDALGFIQLNDSAGDLVIDHQTTFATAGDFENMGRLEVGDSTVFEVPMGSDFMNETAGVLAGGEFELRGALRFDTGGVDTVNTVLTLDGAGAQIQDSAGMDAFTALTLIDSAGDLTLVNGRDLDTSADLTNDGVLTVGDGTRLRVLPGNVLTNFAGGVFTGGTFDLAGTLVFDNAAVEEIDNTLILDGPGNRIETQAGDNGLATLNRIRPDGRLTLRNGHDLMIGENLVVEGELVIENGPVAFLGMGTPTRLHIAGDLMQSAGLLSVENSSFEVEGIYAITGGTFAASGVVRADVENSGGVIMVGGDEAGVLEFQGSALAMLTNDASVSLRVDFASDVNDVITIDGPLSFGAFGGDLAGVLRIETSGGVVGDFADVIFFAGISGGFASVDHPALGGSKDLELEYLGDRVRVHIVPTPGGAVVLSGLAGLAGLRRRNR
ncbi:MAG: hypothetical protein RLN60_01865 [Phycisphaerales bacterium]